MTAFRSPPNQKDIFLLFGNTLTRTDESVLGLEARARRRSRSGSQRPAPRARLALEPVTPPGKTGDVRHKMAGPTGSSPILWHVLVSSASPPAAARPSSPTNALFFGEGGHPDLPSAPVRSRATNWPGNLRGHRVTGPPRQKKKSRISYLSGNSFSFFPRGESPAERVSSRCVPRVSKTSHE
ncbi:hypothetical protein FQA47_013162 [Oryzias melastigma]|uniref:Uncharacterized protein n=1 Tax=Oryzias melastigma TaxID=30732 RepID=A0A834KX46_ORYME|nr:hypothetical protein FQA47_013162 [Oryzias melastigma]